MIKRIIAYILFSIIICNKSFIFSQEDSFLHKNLYSNEIVCNNTLQLNKLKKNELNPFELYDKGNKLSIYIPVLPFIDLFSGLSYRAGCEFKIYSILSAYIEGGGFFYNQPRASWLNNVTGGVGKIGLKFYLSDEASGNYLAIDYLYKKVDYVATDSVKTPQIPTYLKEYEVKREVHAFAIKYGETMFVSKRIIIDLYAGVGIRFINSKKSLSIDEQKGILHGEGNGGLTGSAVRYSGIAPNINVGVKIEFVIAN